MSTTKWRAIVTRLCRVRCGPRISHEVQTIHRNYMRAKAGLTQTYIRIVISFNCSQKRHPFIINNCRRHVRQQIMAELSEAFAVIRTRNTRNVSGMSVVCLVGFI